MAEQGSYSLLSRSKSNNPGRIFRNTRKKGLKLIYLGEYILKSKIMAVTVALVLVLSLIFAIAGPVAAAPITWNVTGTWNINVVYQSVVYPETLVLTQTGNTITGVSVNSVPPVSDSAFSITGGSVTGDSVTFKASYDPNSSETTTFNGAIAANGSMSGTWADDAGFLGRSGTWASTSGDAAQVATSTVFGTDAAPTVAFTAPSGIDLDNGSGMMVAGWNATQATNSGSVTLTEGTSGTATYTVTAEDTVTPYMNNGSVNLQNYLLIGNISLTGGWFIANGGTGIVPTPSGTTYSGVLTYNGNTAGAPVALPFFAAQYVTPTDALGNYTATITFTATCMP
jgi:hypothetical protein